MAVGQKLEEARNRKGISIREVSESTKIRGDYLSAMEASSFDIDLPEVYLRGFVRLYARFLDLDQDAILADLDLELGKGTGKPVRKSLGSIANNEVADGADLIKPGSSISSKSRNNNVSLAKPILLVVGSLISVIIVIGILFFILSDQPEAPLEETMESSTIKEVSPSIDENLSFKGKLVPADVFTLKLVAIGPIGLLIIDDQGEGTPRDFKNLDIGWENKIIISKSFRCHCSDLENLRFSIDNGTEKQIDSTGAGNFSWNP
jgi:hypothetical protein